LTTENYPTKRVYYVISLAIFIVTCTPVLRAEFIADGVELVQLTDDGKSSAVAWAPHSEKVSFIRTVPGSSQNQLFVMNSDGSEQEAVTPIGSTFYVEWSWAGDKVAYMFSNADDGESQGEAAYYDIAEKRSYTISAPYKRSVLDPDEGPWWSSDDRYLAYKARPGVSRFREVHVHDSKLNKTRRVLAERGQVREAKWNRTGPTRVCFRVQAAGGWDLITALPNGTDVYELTDIGAESIGVSEAAWSPTDNWIAFLSNKDMTQQERDDERGDCWICRPDGSQMRNLTKATSAATEKQLKIDEILWSWDGRQILGNGERFDIQGNEIETLYLIDPVNGGYRILLTSNPREETQFEEYEALAWSYDSTKIAILGKRQNVRGWGGQASFEQNRTVLSIYDIQTNTRTDLLIFSDEQDRRMMPGDIDRDEIENITWSPDSSSLLITVADIISGGADGIRRPDVYRVDLPGHLISPLAADHDGPAMGRPQIAGEQSSAKGGLSATTGVDSTVAVVSVQSSGDVITEIKPQHISVEETMESLPSQYKQYLTSNISQNLLVYEGPADDLTRLHEHLKIFDKLAPQIMVDLLAVELTEEANREIGLDWTYAEGHFGLYQPTGRAIQKFPHIGTGEDFRAGFPSGALDSLNTLAGVGQTFYQGVGTLPSEFFIRLNALVSDGKGSILANPRTVATNGKEATIRIRKTLNYFFNEGFDDAGRPIIKKSDISADTEGRITPTLLADGRILMNVDIKVGSFTFSPDAGLPEQTNRESTTVVTVHEGQTLVIGGLRQEEESESVTKVPLLGDLPIIGGLFRNTQKETKNSVLTIFVTPHVLRPGEPVPEWPTIDGEEYKLAPTETGE